MSGQVIPDKFYYKIGEVSAILGVKPYVVRFWETEFNLAPAKNSSKHRVYRRQEVETLLEIKQLLYVERFTIEGAQKKLRERMKDRNRQFDLKLPDNRYKSLLRRVKKDLSKLREILDK